MEPLQLLDGQPLEFDTPEIWVYTAFPTGIPEAIISEQHNHPHPFDGDQGIRFEPRTDRDRELVWELFDNDKASR